ncbi:hypothetical protein BD309DRAFT_959415 [Dichomitus squalens]|uniref:Uncharacterized protein n=1 Tax=Dichomitus squalens TaxID=114155 RepID=A0A4Q9NV51_9APHY|nr:hypothetical protein BD309DRAFT_959415 [Dichomitus squalens]TBU54691.1 hypothetical protein BD310DRAFT_935306 [Dichomitus squalens]
MSSKKGFSKGRRHAYRIDRRRACTLWTDAAQARNGMNGYGSACAARGGNIAKGPHNAVLWRGTKTKVSIRATSQRCVEAWWWREPEGVSRVVKTSWAMLEIGSYESSNDAWIRSRYVSDSTMTRHQRLVNLAYGVGGIHVSYLAGASGVTSNKDREIVCENCGRQ